MNLAKEAPLAVLGTKIQFHENLHCSGLICSGFLAGEFQRHPEAPGTMADFARELGDGWLFALAVDDLSPFKYKIRTEDRALLVLPIANGKLDICGPLLLLHQWRDTGRISCLRGDEEMVIEAKDQPELLDALRTGSKDTRTRENIAAGLVADIHSYAQQARAEKWQAARTEIAPLLDQLETGMPNVLENLGLPAELPENLAANRSAVEEFLLKRLQIQEHSNIPIRSRLRRDPKPAVVAAA